MLAAYFTDNWRAFRTWGVSAISPWEHSVFWKPRADLDRNDRVDLKTDWENLQRPGFSPDYIEDRYERMDLAYEQVDWIATPAADAMYRNNCPLLAYLAGEPGSFTSKDHNFLPGETVEKQVIAINNSRETVTANCEWSFGLPEVVASNKQVTVATGQQERIPLHFRLPADLLAGTYALRATIKFSTGETQEDEFAVHVLPPLADPHSSTRSIPDPAVKIALFDPKGETRELLTALGVHCQSVQADVDPSQYDLLIIGKAALTPKGPVPDISRVCDGLKVIVFEQTSEALEKRLGFRVQEYGLRNVFRRVPDHPYLAGVDAQHLRDWRGESTILPPSLNYEPSDKYNGVPAVRWCGLEVPRLWRCGNRGNVASVLIEKPGIGDFLPIIDGGFSLQYSPLLEYREGKGMVLFCQMDVTGRTEEDPAATRLVRNILCYVSNTSFPVHPARKALYVGDADGKRYFEHAGISVDSYDGGELSPDQVLVVGRGGEKALAVHAPDIAQWLEAGGHLLALELDANEANTFLPVPIRTAKREHIAAYFNPPGVRSLLAGVGPADVHNRDPRELPLVTGGARAVAGGVLAEADDSHVVFCQLAPYSFIKSPGNVSESAVNDGDAAEGEQDASQARDTEPQNLRKTFRRSSYTVTRLLANMGVRAQTPLLSRFSTPASGIPRESVVKNGDFRNDTDDDPMPDHWQFSTSLKQATCVLEADGYDTAQPCLRITCPELGEDERGSVMLAQYDVPVEQRQWYRISLRAKSEGLQGTRVTLALQDTASWRSLFDYQKFVPPEAWKKFTFLVQAKATATSKTRFQIWHESPGTLWLADIHMAPCDPPTQGRWTSGLYIDKPQQWDDPYRFFRW